MRRLAALLIIVGGSCGPVSAQTGNREQLPPSADGPKQQNDIDTLKLAAAHRERAKTTDERTTGLWQSWLVSICEGCASLPPAKPSTQNEASGERNVGIPLRSAGRQPPTPAPRPDTAETKRESGAGSAEANLSDAALERIRRQPR